MAKIKKFDMKGKELKKIGILEKGTYPMKIVASELKKTENKDDMLVLTWEVTKGEFKGRKYWDRILLTNESKQAVEISQDRLASIHRACGFSKIKEDSEDLHNIACELEIVVQKGKGDYGDSNNCVSYEPLGGKKSKGEKSGSSAPWEDEEKGNKKDKKKGKEDKKEKGKDKKGKDKGNKKKK